MARKPNSPSPASSSAPQPSLDRVPPNSLEAEMSLLGAMMLDRHAVGDALQIIQADDFYQPAHQQIAETLAFLYENNTPIDLVTMLNALKERGWLEEIGGAAYLARLAESVPSAANAESYARIVKDKAMLRGFIAKSGELIRDAFAENEAATEFLDRAEHEIFEVTERKQTGHAQAITEVLAMTFDEIDKAAGEGMSGIPTGFFDLDTLLGGFQKGEMIVLAARPSVGKTTVAMNIAEHIAVHERRPVVFYSLEMRSVEIAKRMLASRAHINSRRFREVISEEERDKIMAAANELSQAKLFIDDIPGQTVLDIRSKSRRLKVQHDIELVMIDYLQLLSHRHMENRQVQVAEMSRGIKGLARELEVPVVALSQLNREVEQQNRLPRMSDIRESGAVEQDADVVLLLHKFTPEEVQTQGLRYNALLIVAKNRNGPTGNVPLNFQPEYVRFVPAALYAEA